MAKREPGFYEPSSSDEMRVFDGGEDDVDEEGSRLPLLLVIALIMVFAFGGVVWLAYTQGVQHGREGAPQVIAAAKGPLRTAPANPGGATPYQGLKIYDQRAPTDDDNAAPAHAVNQAPAGQPALREVEAPKPAPEVRPAPEPAKPAPVKHAEVAAAKPAPAKPVEAAPKPAPVKTAAASGPDAYVLQIGAYKSEAEANAAWKSYAHKHPAVAGYTPDIVKADLGAKGTWYRLRIGAYDSREAATAACDKLRAQGAPCFPAKG